MNDVAPRGRFLFLDRQGKGLAFSQALRDRGWRTTLYHERASFVLTDSDTPGRRIHLECARSYGAGTHLFPHSSRPILTWDFPIYSPWEHTQAQYVVNENHAEIMRMYGYSKPLHPVGWSYCEMRPFQPCFPPKKILFGPIHPVVSTGWLSETDKKINRSVFQRLLKVFKCRYIELTVRYLGTLEQNGLWLEPGVNFIQGSPELCTVEIDAADVVISHETLLYMAVAKGKGAIGLAEWETPRSGASKETYMLVEHWDDYKDLVMFPYSILAEDDTFGMIERAARSDIDIAGWRERIIGQPFDADLFVHTLESYL